MLPAALSLRPFSRWPVALHAGLACALVLLVWGATHALVSKDRRWLADSKKQVQVLTEQARSHALAQSSSTTQAEPDFTDSLPLRALTDAVVRDIGRHAQTLGINLSSITVVHSAASPRELGKVQLSITAVGDYGKAKTWLAELLARYTTLAVQSLNVRAGTSAAMEWQLVLTLYVKD
jgi:anaerobic glycerol-3-phosphate dehydrogenase